MDYITIIEDSVETSVSNGIFKNKKDASYAHVFKTGGIEKIPLSKLKNIDNFDTCRLQLSAVKAYPVHDRPRGDCDIKSVKYYQKQIKQNKEITPIWLVHKNKKYILLDGAHRIVSSFIEGKRFINAYVIYI